VHAATYGQDMPTCYHRSRIARAGSSGRRAERAATRPARLTPNAPGEALSAAA